MKVQELFEETWRISKLIRAVRAAMAELDKQQMLCNLYVENNKIIFEVHLAVTRNATDLLRPHLDPFSSEFTRGRGEDGDIEYRFTLSQQITLADAIKIRMEGHQRD